MVFEGSGAVEGWSSGGGVVESDGVSGRDAAASGVDQPRGWIKGTAQVCSYISVTPRGDEKRWTRGGGKAKRSREREPRRWLPTHPVESHRTDVGQAGANSTIRSASTEST